jgi:hypothetical protein
MPHYVVEKVADALNTKRKAINGSRILIAGVAYKRDIDDIRESPALDVMGLLHATWRGGLLHRSVRAGDGARDWSGGVDLHERAAGTRRLRPVSTVSSSSRTTRHSTTTPWWRKRI